MKRQALICGAFIGVALLLAGLAVLVSGCGDAPAAGAGDQQRQEKDLPSLDLPSVRTYKVTREKITRSITLPGSVEGYESADLYAKESGPLAWIKVDIGDRVQGPRYNDKGEPTYPGDELARLWVPEMDKQIAHKKALVARAKANERQAEAAHAQAQAEENSAKALQAQAHAAKSRALAQRKARQVTLKLLQDVGAAVERERVYAAQYELEAATAAVAEADAKIAAAKAEFAAAGKRTAKALADKAAAAEAVKVAQADLEYLQTRAGYRVIRAPFDGVVTRRYVDKGAFIQSAEGNSGAKPLLTVARTDKLRIVIPLPMSELAWLDIGDKAMVRAEYLPGEKPLPARVARFSPGLKTNTRTMRVELELDKPDERILPGSYVTVTLDLVHYPRKESEPAPCVVPATAVRTDAKGKYVLVVNDAAVHRRAVETFYEDGKKVGIQSGVKDGEVVVTGSNGPLADGQKVRTGGGA